MICLFEDKLLFCVSMQVQFQFISFNSPSFPSLEAKEVENKRKAVLKKSREEEREARRKQVCVQGGVGAEQSMVARVRKALLHPGCYCLGNGSARSDTGAGTNSIQETLRS